MLNKKTIKLSSVKITSGVYRSQSITFLNYAKIRPTLGKIRQMLFNWLGNNLNNMCCLDLFAGSGLLGFEALSRGAEYITMVDHEKIHCNYIAMNINKLDNQASEKITILNADVLDLLSMKNNFDDISDNKFDLIFIDPPYDAWLTQEQGRERYHLLQFSLDNIDKVVKKDGSIYCEYNQKIFSPDLSNFDIIKTGKCGVTTCNLIRVKQ